MDRAWLRKVIRDISTFGQIGFSIITPPVVLGGLGYLLNVRFNIGAWIVILAIFLGIITGFFTAAKTIAIVLAKNTKEKEENSTINFRNHY